MLFRTNLQPLAPRSNPNKPQFPVGEQPYITKSVWDLDSDRFTHAVFSKGDPGDASLSSAISFANISLAIRWP